ncbi:MAG TPA: YtxH domain-containing protein [Chryseosolibacter sp.]|jgi:gas vesicle protein|nr:YtxH domain-containing protein [Chryseosolibacter sp.]
MNSTSKTILAVMGAAAVGAIIGMLVAPEKGSDLRRKITDATGDWTSQLSDLLAQGKEQLNNLKNKATSEASNYAAEGEERFNNIKEKI